MPYLEHVGDPDEDEVFLRLYAPDAGPDALLLQVNDFINDEHAEMGLNKEQAAALGLKLLNWAGALDV